MKNSKITIFIVIAMLINTVNVFAIDKTIFTDKVVSTYIGTKEAKPLIQNLNFKDVPNNYWAKEAIVRAGAINIVKGYNDYYKPNNFVSNQEALAFILRIAGLEKQAQVAGENQRNLAKDAKSPLPIWSIGYLSIANRSGLITPQQYNEAISQNQDSLPKTAFKRNDNASREQIINWIIEMLNKSREVPLTSDLQQNIYTFKDWEQTDVMYVENMEIAIDNGIIKGDKNGNLNPKGTVTRAEIAQIISNLDKIYNDTVGLSEKLGTVGGIKDKQTNTTGKASIERNIYIRDDKGTVDIIKYLAKNSEIAQAINEDAVVLKNGIVTGLSSLANGDKLEYLVNDTDKTVKFISVKNSKNIPTELNGVLKGIDFTKKEIKLGGEKNKTFTYPLASGLIGNDSKGEYVLFGNDKIRKNEIPFGSMVNLATKNFIVTNIKHFGTATLQKEFKGVVTENNTAYSYLTVIDEKGQKVTKNYLSEEIQVEKQPYEQLGDDIGYLDEIFPNFNYDPRDTTIKNIEAGDIVFIRTKDNNDKYIDKISASPNYLMKYGEVLDVKYLVDIIKILVKFDNGLTSSYEVPSGVFTSKNGKPIKTSEIVQGDRVKLLINEAILAPGQIMESVKEIIVEPSGHLIGELLKGQISNIDPIQKTISLQNSYSLGKDGWDNYKQIRKLSFENSDAEYYYGGKRTNLGFINSKLKRADGAVYVALEDSYSGNKIKKITFRNGRDEELDADVVVTTDGSKTFAISGYGLVNTDDGTIVRKNGKLVSPSAIQPNDFAKVLLNSDGPAGIVDIYEKPLNNGLNIARVRIKEVNDNKNFIVKSFSILEDNNWKFSPVERKFVIDGNTIYITENGVTNINDFKGYGENTAIDKTFTVIFDGDKATHIIDAPYPTKLVSGVVYENNENIKLKDAMYLKDDNTLGIISVKNPTINITYAPNTLFIKNDKLISKDDIKKGDKLNVMTEILPKNIESSMTVDARIVFVKN